MVTVSDGTPVYPFLQGLTGGIEFVTFNVIK